MKNYKTIFGIFASAALVVLVSSCNLNKLPVFDDNDAFAAFEATSYTVDENVGIFSIPVTVASVKGLSTTVTYSTDDGTAFNGVNYVVVDENGNEDNSGVLTFASGERTKYINIKITEINDENCDEYGYPTGFTGNFSFTVNLVSSTAVNLGVENTCSVTITDLDHPLASLVGTYACFGYDYWGEWEWNAEMYTDPDDPTIIWICGIDIYYEDLGIVDDVYGVVTLDDDNNPCLITVTLPYWVGFDSYWYGYYICYTTTYEGTSDPGVWRLEYDAELDTWVSLDMYWVGAFNAEGDFGSYEGWMDYCEEGATFTKID